jgi:hypothetical protein
MLYCEDFIDFLFDHTSDVPGVKSVFTVKSKRMPDGDVKFDVLCENCGENS